MNSYDRNNGERANRVTDSSGLVGKKLGDYILKRRFASGGMAHIYLGEDEKLGRMAAIKVLPPDMGKHDTVMRQRFEREARAIAQLEHDNIIPIYQFGEYADTYFLAMRYIEGQDLSDIVYEEHQQGKLIPINRALNLLEQVAAALDYAHQRGIIHRDVKPSNILVSESNERAYLSDFGLVLWQSVDQTMGTAFGTPRYISPEQATDSQSAVPQSDIYSLGVIVYEILTGHPLFNAPSPLEVALAHITQTPTPPRAHNPSIPVKAQNEILKALAKDPAQRHESALDLIRSVREAYENTDPETAGTRPIPPDKVAIDSSPDILKWDDMPTTAYTPSKRPEGLEPPPTMPDPKATPSIKPVPSAPEDEDRPTAKIPPVTLPEKKAEKPKEKTDPKLRAAAAEKKAQENRRRAQRRQAMLIAGALVGLILLGALFILRSQFAPAATNLPTATPNPELAAVTSEATTLVTTDIIATAEVIPTDITPTLPTATVTATYTLTPTLTLTPTATLTPTLTLTLTPSATPSPTITNTPETSVIVTADPQAAPNVIARYNDRVFTMTNIGAASIVITEMGFATSAGTENFVNNNALGATLLPNDCIVIKAGVRSSAEVPEEWNCNASVTVTTNVEQLFWFAETTEDTAFTVQMGATVMTTCDTMGRIVRRLDNGVCSFNWAITADG